MDATMIHEPILYFSALAVAIAGIIYPWRLSTPSAGRLSLLPVLAFVIYVIYEATNDPAYNIRVDMLLMLPALGASLLAMLIRIGLVQAAEARGQRPAR
ncbi:MAG: hypothetical protein AAF078_03075 [Planctomycetota bacterium]